MELTQINNANNVDYLNKKEDNLNTQSLISNKKVDNNDSVNFDTVELTLSKSSDNNFINKISSTLNKVAALQQTQSNISNQLEITSKIVKITSSASNSSTTTLDDQQPEIKNLLDTYNNLSQNSNSTEGFDEEGIFFDGILGSKPLSSQQILEAVENQRSKLYTKQESVNSDISALVSDAKQTIETEKIKVETKIEFKNIDFEKESTQFNSSTLSSIKEGIIPSQANAKTSTSIELLA